MRIAVLGDSITEGIGRKKVNYCSNLERQLNNSVVKNFGFTGSTIRYTLKIQEEVLRFNPDVLIVFYGNVDALPRVNSNSKIYKLLPKRYKALGMMDPRALYSSKKAKRAIQKIDSAFRYRLKKVLLKTTGSIQWVNIVDFEDIYTEFLLCFKDTDTKIILLSTVPMYEKYFPKANEEYIKYNNIIHKLAKEMGGQYIDLYNELQNYSKEEIYLSDYFHPNAYGYEVISKLIVRCIDDGNCKMELSLNA